MVLLKDSQEGQPEHGDCATDAQGTACSCVGSNIGIGSCMDREYLLYMNTEGKQQ